MAQLQTPRARRLLQIIVLCIAVISLCLVAAHPFLQGRMPHSADGLLQMVRSVALEYSLGADHPLWPRYSSGLVYGYGAPLFNYFPPLSYFPAIWLHQLGFDYVVSWLLTMVAFTAAAALGMAALARLWAGSWLAGGIAALAYVYAPYFLFDSVARGTSPEVAALAALPYALYGFTRLARYGRRRDFLWAVLTFALFIPLHTLMTLHGSALLVFYCLLLCWRASDRRAVFFRLLLAGAAALLLTAFYWLPALLETDAIKLNLITEQLGALDVVRNLRPLEETLALPHRADLTQQNQAVPATLGWIQIGLALAGLLLSMRRPGRTYRALLLVLGGTTLLLTFMNTPASAVLWKKTPLIGYTQFPWRLLGPASLALALMAGIGARLLLDSAPAGRWRLLLGAGMAAALMIYALPWTYTAYHDDIELRDIRDVQQLEGETGQLALSSYAEYLPLHTDAAVLDARALGERFALTDIIPRLLPSGTLEIVSQRWTGTSAEVRMISKREQTLVFDWLFLPGWRAWIDGEPVEVFPSAPAGLVALDAPEGEFELRLMLGATAAQSLSLWISALGLLTALALLALWPQLPRLAWDAPSSEANEMPALAVVVLISLAVFALKVIVLDGRDTVFQTARFGAVDEAAALAYFDHRIDLLAYELPADPIEGNLATFRLFWRLHDTPLDENVSSIVRMRDPWGHVVAEASNFAPGGLETPNWLSGFYVEDVILLEIPPFTPPLEQAYQVEVALFDARTLAALPWINDAGNPQDVRFPLGALHFRPDVDSQSAQAIDHSDAAERFDTPAVLLELSDTPAAATAGDELSFHWTWLKRGESGSGLTARLLWLDAAGAVAGSSPALPLAQGYDFARWRSGAAYRGHHAAIVPADLAAGQYRLAIEALDAGGNPVGDLIELERAMEIAIPQRRFDAPGIDFQASAAWDNGIVLQGYSFSETGEVELVWGNTQPLLESLRLFVHVLGEGDLIVTQWDGVPVDWTRPTTGWLPGEVVTTRQAFDIAAGEYALHVGWYSPNTGARIGIGGRDALRLERPLIIE